MGLLVHMANDFEKKIFFVNQTTVATDFLVTIIIVYKVYSSSMKHRIV